MRDSHPSNLASKLIKTYNTRDPFTLARKLGIELLFRDDFSKLKGAFKVVEDVPFIFINANLSEQMQTFVCAHELGHALLHRHIQPMGIMESDLLNTSNELEYEANAFAAVLILDEDEICEMVYEGADLTQIARTLETHVSIILIRLNEINRRRHIFSNLPELPPRAFLGRIGDDSGHL